MARSYVHEARRRVGPKKQRIRPIIERLAVEHADAKIALRFTSPLELLVSVMLSAQTTDVNDSAIFASACSTASRSTTGRIRAFGPTRLRASATKLRGNVL